MGPLLDLELVQSKFSGPQVTQTSDDSAEAVIYLGVSHNIVTIKWNNFVVGGSRFLPGSGRSPSWYSI